MGQTQDKAIMLLLESAGNDEDYWPSPCSFVCGGHICVMDLAINGNSVMDFVSIVDDMAVREAL